MPQMPQPPTEVVMHPKLGPLQFPKDMPYDQRNQLIEEAEQTHAQGDAAAERFIHPPQASLLDRIGHGISEGWDEAKGIAGGMGDLGSALASNVSGNPLPLVRTGGAMIAPQFEEAQEARTRANRGDTTGSLFHSVAAGVPIAGPMAGKIYDQVEGGDTAGGVGRGVVDALTFAGPKLVPRAAGLAAKVAEPVGNAMEAGGNFLTSGEPGLAPMLKAAVEHPQTEITGQALRMAGKATKGAGNLLNKIAPAAPPPVAEEPRVLTDQQNRAITGNAQVKANPPKTTDIGTDISGSSDSLRYLEEREANRAQGRSQSLEAEREAELEQQTRPSLTDRTQRSTRLVDPSAKALSARQMLDENELERNTRPPAQQTTRPSLRQSVGESQIPTNEGVAETATVLPDKQAKAAAAPAFVPDKLALTQDAYRFDKIAQDPSATAEERAIAERMAKQNREMAGQGSLNSKVQSPSVRPGPGAADVGDPAFEGDGKVYQGYGSPEHLTDQSLVEQMQDNLDRHGAIAAENANKRAFAGVRAGYDPFYRDEQGGYTDFEGNPVQLDEKGHILRNPEGAARPGTGPGAMLRKGSSLRAKSGPMTGKVAQTAQDVYDKMDRDESYEPTKAEEKLLEADADDYERWENEMGEQARAMETPEETQRLQQKVKEGIKRPFRHRIQ